MVDFTKKVGTQIRFFITAEFSPVSAKTNYTVGTPTDVVLTFASVATATGRQSAKADLGANRAAAYSLDVAVDFTGETPTAGKAVYWYWAPSTHATTAQGNVAGNSGADAAAPGSPIATGMTIAEFVALCVPIGPLRVTDDATVQNGHVGVLSSPTRYGQLVYVNESGDVFEANNVEAHACLTPIVDTDGT